MDYVIYVEKYGIWCEICLIIVEGGMGRVGDVFVENFDRECGWIVYWVVFVKGF